MSSLTGIAAREALDKVFHRRGRGLDNFHRRRLLTTDASRRTFEAALERVRRSFNLRVYAYVIMPEHVHLLLSEPERGLLADALKSLKQGISRRLIGSAEHFWQKTVLRFQHPELPAVCGEGEVYSSQSGEERLVRAAGRLGVEQLPPLCDGMRRTSGDRVGVDGEKTPTCGRKTLPSRSAPPLKPKPGLSGPPALYRLHHPH